MIDTIKINEVIKKITLHVIIQIVLFYLVLMQLVLQTLIVI